MPPDREKAFAVVRASLSTLLVSVAAVLFIMVTDPRLRMHLFADERVALVFAILPLPLLVIAAYIGSPALLVLGDSLPPKGELERLLQARSYWLQQWEVEHRSFSSGVFIRARQRTRSAEVQPLLPEEGYLDRLTEIKSQGGWLPRDTS